MRRLWAGMLMMAAAQPSFAGVPAAPYYGPAKHWHGIGYKFGYEDFFEKDGRWRIETAVRSGEPADMALYRAAERARDAGYRYIVFLGGHEVRGPGVRTATLYARPSSLPDIPVDCPSRRKSVCYTADVGEVLRILGGPNGTQPGVAIVDHQDRYGRSVTVSGYGTGAVGARTAPVAPVPAPPPTSIAARSIARPALTPADEAQARFDAALHTQQPVNRHRGSQGWTVSD